MYIDACHDRRNNRIKVVERDKNGNRVFVNYDAEYTFYYSHPSGSFTSIFGDSCKKYSTSDHRRFTSELKKISNVIEKGKPKHTIFESDINPIFRCLSNNYSNCDTPTPNIAFFDIETGFCQKLGFAPASDPFNPVTAISLYLTQNQSLVTLALLPPGMSVEKGEEIVSKFDDTYLFTDEEELLDVFLSLIGDSDILSGWNCIPLTENVWLNDRIKPLGEIKTGDLTFKHGLVENTVVSGMKKVNRITLSNGSVLLASDEHVIPVLLNNIIIDKTVKELKLLSDVYLTYNIRNNTNPYYEIDIDALGNQPINVETISRLSRKQFDQFMSVIDVEKLSMDDLRKIQELLAWNGIFSSIKNGLEILDHETYLKIDSIEELDEEVLMGDIMTEKSYFTCSGIDVHNSELYDIPYLVNRVKRMMPSDALKKFCLWGVPQQREIIKFGKSHEAYDLSGRVHLDYLSLYQKHNPQQMHSYKLDYIGEVEVGENKVQYEGSLDELYNNDFEKFIDYSRQDVMLLVKIDKKKRFIDLSNQVAHVNSVLLKNTLGSVTLVEQAIINEMHSKGFVVPCRKEEVEDDVLVPINEDDELENDELEEKHPVVGAYVANPRVGISEYIGCVDINSLYPSAIRALNISPETIVGQIRPDMTNAMIKERIESGIKREDTWNGVFALVEFDLIHDKTDDLITIDFDDGNSLTKKASYWYDYIFDAKNKLCISANGTLFSTRKEGMIPQLLEKWYSERKQMQGLERSFSSILEDGLELPADILDALNL